MPVKRSRIGRSSSFGETNLLSHVSPPWETRTAPNPSSNNPTKVLKTENAVVSDVKVMSLSSPVQESVCGADEVGGFLDKCFYCKKMIRENAEVFMYGYLRAFCTAECRGMQISLDNVVEKQSTKTKSAEVASRCQDMANGER